MPRTMPAMVPTGVPPLSEGAAVTVGCGVVDPDGAGVVVVVEEDAVNELAGTAVLGDVVVVVAEEEDVVVVVEASLMLK